jgi:hypothetical protein
MNGCSWPKAAFRRHRKGVRLCDSHERLESTHNGPSSLLMRMSAIRSQNGRPITAISEVADSHEKKLRYRWWEPSTASKAGILSLAAAANVAA